METKTNTQENTELETRVNKIIHEMDEEGDFYNFENQDKIKNLVEELAKLAQSKGHEYIKASYWNGQIQIEEEALEDWYNFLDSEDCCVTEYNEETDENENMSFEEFKEKYDTTLIGESEGQEIIELQYKNKSYEIWWDNGGDCWSIIDVNSD